jgi:hypothetical protein
MGGNKFVTCKCGARIVWLITRDGKNMPCDLESVPPTDHQYDRDRGHVAHWASCPRREEHKRARPAAPRPRPESQPLLELMPEAATRPRFMTHERMKQLDQQLAQAQIKRADFRVIREAVGPRGDPLDWDETQFYAAIALIASTAEARDHATARMKGEAS